MRVRASAAAAAAAPLQRYAAACSVARRSSAWAMGLGAPVRLLARPRFIAGQVRSFHATAAQNMLNDRSWHMGIIVVPQQMAYVSSPRALLACVCVCVSRACACVRARIVRVCAVFPWVSGFGFGV